MAPQSHVALPALQTMSGSKYSVAKGTSVVTKRGYSLSTKAECAKCVTEFASKHLQPINFVIFCGYKGCNHSCEFCKLDSSLEPPGLLFL